MTAIECDGRTAVGEACDSRCDPHIEERNRLIAKQEVLLDIAYRVDKSGVLSEDEVSLLYAEAEAVWDDGIHIASPTNGHLSLCGQRGRNLAPLSGDRPGGGEGCWTCLTMADRFAALGETA